LASGGGRSEEKTTSILPDQSAQYEPKEGFWEAREYFPPTALPPELPPRVSSSAVAAPPLPPRAHMPETPPTYTQSTVAEYYNTNTSLGSVGSESLNFTSSEYYGFQSSPANAPTSIQTHSSYHPYHAQSSQSSESYPTLSVPLPAAPPPSTTGSVVPQPSSSYPQSSSSYPQYTGSGYQSVATTAINSQSFPNEPLGGTPQSSESYSARLTFESPKLVNWSMGCILQVHPNYITHPERQLPQSPKLPTPPEPKVRP